MANARVYVLYTGGTFGMAPNRAVPGHPLSPLPIELLQPLLPSASTMFGNADIHVVLEGLPLGRQIDSSSMVPSDWVEIAQRIYSNYSKYDGFVVIQGTDTLSYTASALSFMFENLDKPIVITGSQLPLGGARTDAILNYCHSVMVAGYKATDLPRICEVVVVFADKILRGCRTRKMSASAWTGFDSPNAPPLGEIGEHVRIFESQLRPAPLPGLGVQLHSELVADVLDVSLYPGLRPDHLRLILGLKNIKGVILRTFGAGNAPDSSEFLCALGDSVLENDKAIVNITQCPQGSVEMGLYEASVGLMDLGVLSGLDMTPEAALTKLMVLLGTRIGDQVRLQMQISQRGEQSQSLFDIDFESRELMSDQRYSAYSQPDRRFKSHDLSVAVFRISDLDVAMDEHLNVAPAIYVFMNAPRADPLKVGFPDRCIHMIELNGVAQNKGLKIVQPLPKELVRNIIGDSDIVLTLVPTPGVRFGFKRLSLSLFARA